MASLKYAPDIRELRSMKGMTSLSEKYAEVADSYNAILDKDIVLCPKCGEFKKREQSYYNDDRFITKKYPICKECLLKMVEQKRKDRDEPNETKESVQKVLQMLDRPYDDHFYDQCVKGAMDGVKEKTRNSPFATYITSIMSLPQWKDKTYRDSDFGSSVQTTELSDDEFLENEEILKKARKRFGRDYNNVDLIFLETEYEDWTTRNVCETKTQELLFKRICFKELEIDKLQKEGKDTKEADKTLQELLGSAQLKPSQTGANSLADSNTFSQMIDLWEHTRPIPEPSDEFKDVDGIGQLIDVFFKGHLAKMMGLKNAFSAAYDRFMKKYTVTKPEYEDDEINEELFEKMFGKLDE